MSPTSELSTHCKEQQQAREWIPCWLRKRRALSVAAFCIVFAICLEVLNFSVNRKNGLSVSPQDALPMNAARYLPTFGAVCLGFMWKAVVQDAKIITPWSTMSGKWSKTTDSVGLDYITTIEPVVLFKAASRRHWAVFVGLLLGFVCGALVAVANSLTYVDLFATHSEATHFLKTTTFSYGGISPKPDGELPIPYTHLGQKPYAAVAAERLPGGQSAPWSKDNYAFESFNSTSQLVTNDTIQAIVQSFHSDFLCHSINFTILDPNDKELGQIFHANVSNRPELNCANDLFINLQQDSRRPGVKGLINTTTCADNETDTRLLSVLAWYESDLIPTETLAVLCKTSFATREAIVRADWVTGDVLEYNFTSSPATQQDIETSMDAIYTYLNNPLDSRTQYVYYTYSDYEQILPGYAHAATSGFLAEYGIDPFNDLITNHLSESVINAFQKDPEQYRIAVEQLSNSIMGQVLSAFARENSSQTIDGILKKAEPKMFLRQQSLRIFQALLCLLALACILQTTVLRPRTCLIEDPGSIASMAVLLARWEDYVSDILSLRTPSTDKDTESPLAPFLWQLQSEGHQTACLMATERHLDKSHSSETRDNDGFRPLSLRLWAKLAVSGAILAVMVTESILLLQSHSKDGLYNNTAIASTISTFVPTVVLLLLGYACSGIDSSVRIMTPYRALSSKLSGTKSPLLFNLRDVPSIRMPFRAVKNRFGSAVLASSFAILLIPPLKITTAGLYHVDLVETRDSIRVELDTSLINDLIGAFNAMDHEVEYRQAATPGPNEIVQSASRYAEWALNPDFNIPIRLGILDNLVFSNITALSGFPGDEQSLSVGEMNARVPAIEVDVKCNTAPVALYGTYQNCSASGQSWIKFDFACSTELCNSTINGNSPMLPQLSIGSKSEYCSTNNPESRFAGKIYMDSDMGYQVFLVDWGDAVGYVTNKTQMPFSFGWAGNATGPLNTVYDGYNFSFYDWVNPQYVLLEPEMLNISLPELRAVKCYSSLSRITVDTTFTRTRATGLHNTILSSWNPARYDASSISREAQYDGTEIPYWLAPYTVDRAWVMRSAEYQYGPHVTFGDSLWPRLGSSGSFFELLASYGEYRLGNVSSILEIDNFVQASTAMYTAYAVNLLTELRPFAINASADARENTQTIDAEAVYPSARIKQDFATTIATECLLLIMFLCFAWVSFRVPSRAILPKNPGSIAARASLLAKSRLVEQLRDANIRSVKGAEHIWQEKAGLGWWPLQKPSKESTHVVDGGSESDTNEFRSENIEERDGMEVVSEVEYGEIGNRNAECGAGSTDGDESRGCRTSVINNIVEASQRERDGRLESAREEERLLDPIGEQPKTRPLGEETALKGGDSGEHGLRWGIDIGNGMIEGSWRQPPASDSRV